MCIDGKNNVNSMKRTSVSRSHNVSDTGITRIGSSIPHHVEELRFREQDGRPSACTRLYAQGVDLMVHKDRVYEKFGLRKSISATSNPSTKAKPQPSHTTPQLSHTTPPLHHSTSMYTQTRASSSKTLTTERTRSINAPIQTLNTRESLSRSKCTSSNQEVRQGSKKRQSSNEIKSPPKPQRRQSTIATQLLNKTLKIKPAIIHNGSSVQLNTGLSGERGSRNVRAPRMSMTQVMEIQYLSSSTSPNRRQSTIQQLNPNISSNRRQSTVQIHTSHSDSVYTSNSAARPKKRDSTVSSLTMINIATQPPPVMIPVSRRTSSPLILSYV